MKRLTTMLCGLGFGLFISSLLLLAGCAKQEAEGDRLPDGQHPMTFTASVEGPTATRATTDNSWTGGEEVAIQIGNEVKRYTAAAATDVLSAASDVTPFYWQTTADIEVTAWHSYSYSSARPASFTVQADQSGAGYQQSDMLYAAAQQVTFADRALTFKHLPAKVVVNLTNGDGVTAAEVTNATVTIENQALTSGAISLDWAVTPATSGSTILTPNVLPTPTTDYLKSLQAIVVPQQMQSQKFIRVTAGGNDYFYTPTNATDANLEAGKQYTYNITVKKNGLTVKASKAAGWTDKGEITEVDSKEIKQGFAATDLKVCDFYYSDGTWSDGGYRVYTDDSKVTLPIVPVLTNPTTGAEREVIGIVMKVGKDNSGSWIDDCQYKLKDGTTEMNTIHGYVLALYDANEGNWATWGSDGTEVGTQTTVAEGFDGYKNTNTIKTFANNNGSNLKTAFPSTYYATDGYEATHPSPDNTSGWFFPSIGQCQYWFNNKTILLASVQKATGIADYKWSYWYWSSSEYNINTARIAWYLDFNESYVYCNGKYDDNWVRSVLAF